MIKIKNAAQALLETDLAGKPLPQRFGIRCFQILYASLRDLSDGHLSLQAMSLVYTTLITLVPLLAISFSVLKGFGVHNQIEPFLLNLLEGLGPEKSQEVTAQVITFVDNIQVGVLGAIGLGLLIYAVIALMQKIEAAFNYIWRVGRDRTISQRFSDYLSVLLMGPLLIFLSAGATTTLRKNDIVQSLESHSLFVTFYDFYSVLLPWIVMAVGFTFVFVYMPNTKVKIRAAFAGGLVAAMLWKAMGFLFYAVIASSNNYVAIYAAFATLIILMIWLYASWLVILIGSNISFYVQYPRYLRVSREPLVLSPHMRMMLGLSILNLVTKHHYKGEEPWSVDGLSKNLNVPILAVQKVVGVLEDGGILTSSLQNEAALYYPAVPLDETPLEKAIDALEKQGRQGWLQDERMNFPPEARNIMDTIQKSRDKAISSKSIAEALGHK